MLLKTSARDGKPSLHYVSLGFVTGQGPQAHSDSLKLGAEDTIGFQNPWKISNHMTTDGEYQNIRQHYGLWNLIEDERNAKSLDFPV